ncbi:MAG TPA: sigma-70 family RNA polymerase sigma factor, partial [Planctomycetota bacterium]|nr:sigma-70 family RNA polymerase sigma factor [Planctomycetota bacterium]
AVSLEELLAQAGWLRALASSLVRDSASAEDLVQDTWLVALTRRPRSGRPLRPWLARVVRNLASNRRRAEGRRTEHELDARLPSAPQPAEEIVGELEAQRALVEALLQLEEPLRSTLVLRYYRGLDASQIARRQGVPAGTVRWRLKRGIDELRARLDARFGGSRSSWCLLLEPLALAKLAEAGSSGAIAGGALAPGVLVMSVSVKVAAAAAVLGIAGGWWWSRTYEGAREELTGSGPAVATASPPSRAAPQPGSPPEDKSSEPQLASSSVDRSSADRRAIPETAAFGSNDLVVRVVDPAGQPLAGVPLRLISAQRQPKETGRSFDLVPAAADGGHEAEMAGVTDGAGLAVFPDMRDRLRNSEQPWILRHDVVFERPPTVALDEVRLAQGVVVSVQPYSGSFEVVVRESDRQAPPRECWGEMALARDPGTEGSQRSGHGPSWRAEAIEGRAVFSWVELNRTWDIAAWPSGATIFRARNRAEGPTRPGERASGQIVLDAEVAVAEFRALDAEGSPLAHALLDVTRLAWLIDENLRCRTDDLGRFRVYLDDMSLLDSKKEGLRYTDPERNGLLVSYRPSHGPGHKGRARLPASMDVGVNAGGDVVLRPESILARGVVTDEAGNPVEGAQVIASVGERRYLSVSGDSVRELRCRSGPNGEFELRGLLRTETIEVRAETHGLRSVPLTVREGALDLRLVLSSTYGLSGRFLVDPGIDPALLELSVETMQPAVRVVSRGHPRQDGSFSLGPLKEGIYRLAVSLGSSPITSVDGIALPADVHLGSTDLRGRIHRCEIVLTGARDAERMHGEIGWRPSGSSEAWTSSRFEGSRAELFVPSLPIDVWVRPASHRHGVLRDVLESAEFQLAEPFRVRLELRTRAQLPSPPYSLMPDLWQEGVRVGLPEGAAAFTEGDRSVVWLVTAPERVRVRWKLEKRHGTASWSGNVLEDHGVEIEVKDVAGEQVFEIDLDGQALEQLIEAPPW